MPRITRVYTRTGDDGTTALGGGQRVAKDSSRIETYGTVDELNSMVGAARVHDLAAPLPDLLAVIQNELFHLGSDLCIAEDDKKTTPVPGIEARHVDRLESIMDELSKEIPPLENFVLPGGSPGAADLHVARAVCRRAERLAVTLARTEAIGPYVIRYLNRLSDLLFVMARYENRKKGLPDVIWDSRS